MARLGKVLMTLNSNRLPVHITPVMEQMLPALAEHAPDHLADATLALLDPDRTDATLDQIEGSGKVTAGEDTGKTVNGERSFTYSAPSSAGTAVFEVTVPVGTSSISEIIVVAIGEAAAPDAISLDLRAGGRIVAVTASGPQTTARALFGDAINSAWKYNQDTGAWDVVYIPGRSGNFSINTGDILYVDSPIDQTVGG